LKIKQFHNYGIVFRGGGCWFSPKANERRGKVALRIDNGYNVRNVKCEIKNAFGKAECIAADTRTVKLTMDACCPHPLAPALILDQNQKLNYLYI
jgi:hypothetical protein